MGMDVYGKKPKNEDGKYFRANVWGWRPINALMQHLHERHDVVRIRVKTIPMPEDGSLPLADQFGGDVFDAMSQNDGAGLNATNSKRMADAIDKFIADGCADLPDFMFVEKNPEAGRCLMFKINGGHPMWVHPDGQFGRGKPPKTARSPYGVPIDYLQIWVKFLRNCGGFKVF